MVPPNARATRLSGRALGVQTRRVPVLRKLIPCLVIATLIAACSGGDSNSSVTSTPSSSPTPSASAGLPAERVTFYGAEAGDQAGAIVSGDFNGDGARDVVVGAALADGPDNARKDGGEVYLFLGPFQQGRSLDAGAGQYDAIFYGAVAGDNLGRTLAAGDFNHDGIDDVAMAAPAANNQAGAVYLMFGGAWPQQTDFASADADVLLRGGAAGDFAGLAMSAGDLDSDGVYDLVIGALLADGPQSSRADGGAVYVLRGQQLVAGDNIDLEIAAGVVYGAKAGDRLGEALTTSDANGDGKADLILVATFSAGPEGARTAAGETYVIDSPATFPIDLATAAPQLEIVGADAGDQLGHSIGAGDTNGGGAADIWLGAVSADGRDNQANLAGEGVLVLGGASRTGVLDTAAEGAAATTIYGLEPEMRVGRSAAVGDLNGDGHADMLISAPNALARAGQVFVFFGGGAYPPNTTGANITLAGLDAGDILGHESFGTPSLSVADVDADGRGDVLTSAPAADGPDNNRVDCGEVYLIPGTALRG